MVPHRRGEIIWVARRRLEQPGVYACLVVQRDGVKLTAAKVTSAWSPSLEAPYFGE